VWNIKTSVTVNTGAGGGITNTLEALTVRLWHIIFLIQRSIDTQTP
jgi:hypothetical protein